MTSSLHSRRPDATQIKCAIAAELVRHHGSLRFRANGISMLPAVRPGDVVNVRRAEASALVPGDLVLVENSGYLRLHRFVAALPDGRLVTRGDSLGHDDSPVLPGQVLGIAISIERRGCVFAPRRQPSRFGWLFSSSPFGGLFTRVFLRVYRALGANSPREIPSLVP